MCSAGCLCVLLINIATSKKRLYTDSLWSTLEFTSTESGKISIFLDRLKVLNLINRRVFWILGQFYFVCNESLEYCEFRAKFQIHLTSWNCFWDFNVHICQCCLQMIIYCLINADIPTVKIKIQMIVLLILLCWRNALD